MRRNRAYLLLGFIGLFVFALRLAQAQTNLTDTAAFSFANNAGAVISLTPGATINVGYAKVQPTAGPAMMEIVGFRPGANLIDELVIPAAPLITTGRMYVRLSGSVVTGAAFANPNNQSVSITYVFTDQTGTDSEPGFLVLDPNGQKALFFNQAPFSGAPATGTLSFISDAPVSIIGLRGFTNERPEFLLTAFPVSSLASLSTDTVIVPHWANGGGFSDRVVLINPTDQVISGTAQFMLGSGSAATLTVNGSMGSSFPYSIEARSVQELATSGSGNVQTGSVRMTPGNGTNSPEAFSFLSFKPSTITVSEAVFPAVLSDTAFRVYVENSGASVSGGVVIANPSANQISVTFTLTSLSGSSLGSTSLQIPGNGQVSMLASQLFPALPSTVQGILRATSMPALVPSGIRFRVNERSDFLLSGVPAFPENGMPGGVLPHIPLGGGFSSQVILFSRASGQMNSGTVKFITQAGGKMLVIKRFAGQLISQ